ncbi:hypothetical protein C2S52_018716 [Perilla frutescens var. hirtella]|nr:hypothetical protein C2S52_018716 [Perilla frutescens var. hirtella]
MSAADKVKSVEVVSVMSKITEHMLCSNNYMDWRQTIELYLLSISMDHHISDDPPSDETTKMEWMRKDAHLFLSIRNSIDSTVIGLITHCKTVKSLLKYLEFLYSGKENVSCMFDVCQAFYRPQKGDRSLTDYFMAFKKTYAELNELLPFDTDISVQQTQREKMAVMSFLTGLSSDFEIAKSQVLSDTKISSLDEKFSRILHNEHLTVAPSEQHSSALLSRAPTYVSGKPPYKNGGSKSPSGPGQCMIMQSVVIALRLGISSHQEWNSSSSGLTTALADSVTLADGSQSIVRGSGTVHPTSSSSLSFVLSLPELSFNLLSVSKLTHHLNCSASFFPDYYLFQDLTTKHIIGKEHESDGLYILDTPPSSSVACVVTPMDAHYRLGHPSLPLLKKLCPQFSELLSLDCESWLSITIRNTLGFKVQTRRYSVSVFQVPPQALFPSSFINGTSQNPPTMKTTRRHSHSPHSHLPLVCTHLSLVCTGNTTAAGQQRRAKARAKNSQTRIHIIHHRQFVTTQSRRQRRAAAL